MQEQQPEGALFRQDADSSAAALIPAIIGGLVGALIGGGLGGRLAGRVRPATLRRLVVAIGLVVGVIYLLRA